MAHSVDSDIGQLLVGGFAGPDIDPDFAELARAGRVGGVVLFRRNLPSLHEVRSLTGQLHQLHKDPPLLVALDQEGGRVQRLKAPFPEMPPMRSFGQRGDEDLCWASGRIVGAALRSLGFDQNYAPVLDVDSNPNNPVIGDRAFSSNPELVSRLGVMFGKALESVGVAACGKHFPGHGDTEIDSHLALPTIKHPRSRLEALEWVPFLHASKCGLSSIMTAHLVLEAFDENPSTLSGPVLSILRKELGFAGVIVSDDLEMKAIADHFGVAEAAVLAVQAGCDQVLICEHPHLVDEAFRALQRAVHEGQLSAEQIRQSADRVRTLKARFVSVESEQIALPPPGYESLVASFAVGGAALFDPTERA